jgi:hypothetical protein
MAQVNSSPGQNQAAANATYSQSTVQGYTLSTQDNNTPGQMSFNYDWQNVVASQSAIPNGSPGVIGSGTLAVVTPPITSASPINTPSPGLTAVTAQLTTQVNPLPLGFISVVEAEQQLAVVGPIYQSAGGILNKGGGITTGGGP